MLVGFVKEPTDCRSAVSAEIPGIGGRSVRLRCARHREEAFRLTSRKYLTLHSSDINTVTDSLTDHVQKYRGGEGLCEHGDAQEENLSTSTCRECLALPV